MREVILLASLCFLPSAISAQRITDVRQGVRIEITDQAGHTKTGKLLWLSEDSIYYAVGDTTAFRIPLSDVRFIRASIGHDHGKGAIQGGLIGAGTGILSGVVLAAVTYKKPHGCEYFCLRTRGDAMELFGLLGGILGSTLGFALGAAVGTENWAPVAFKRR